MITSKAWAGKRYAVLGLARSGAATVGALLASGAEVVAWDEDAERRAAFPNVRMGDPLALDLAGYAGVVVSPGVPLNTHPIKPHADSFGVPVIGDIELFALARAELPPHKVVGITGTNGKSTTTALVHHILRVAGVSTTMGGNIGLPILAQEPLPAGGVYVLELSSFQIDLTFSLDCDVAVLLNITPDHLDRYASFEDYAASKARLFEMQLPTRQAIFGDSSEAACLVAAGRANAHVVHGEAYEDDTRRNLAGPHNAENIGVAAHTCLALGISEDAIWAAVESFPGLPHRLERVRERDGVLFVNDSKATNPDSAAPALAAFERVHWIVGGQAKTEDLGPCAAQLGHVRAAYAIGEAGSMFARLLRDRVPYVEDSQTLENAVESAAARAQPGDVVLLSPACASFDQFRDFEARGDRFRALVEGL